MHVSHWYSEKSTWHSGCHVLGAKWMGFALKLTQPVMYTKAHSKKTGKQKQYTIRKITEKKLDPS